MLWMLRKESNPDRKGTAGQFQVNGLRKGLKKLPKRLLKQDDLGTGMDGGKAAHTAIISGQALKSHYQR